MRIVINWKWLPIPAIEADDEPAQLIASPFVKEISVNASESKVVQVNLQREEADFEDEYEELYDERNELLLSILMHDQENQELLVFLHKNAPHYYGEYDVDWFQSRLPQAKIVLFGGGEDFLYDLHNASSGLLDQVGNFSLHALDAEGQVKTSYFEGIWNHYCGKRSAIRGYTFIREIMEELLPIFQVETPSTALVEKAQAFLKEEDHIADLPELAIQELQALANGQLPDLRKLHPQK